MTAQSDDLPTPGTRHHDGAGLIRAWVAHGQGLMSLTVVDGSDDMPF